MVLPRCLFYYLYWCSVLRAKNCDRQEQEVAPCAPPLCPFLFPQPLSFPIPHFAKFRGSRDAFLDTRNWQVCA
jgi:hypothetical protein